MGLFDRLYRPIAGSVLQLPGRPTVGVAVNRQCPGERDSDGNNVAHAATPRWLSLAMDS